VVVSLGRSGSYYSSEGASDMSDELSQEILIELRKINEKLDKLNEPKGLSVPMKIIALFLGFTVVGPIITLVLTRLLN
jgi:hypothetical protein